MITMFNGRTVYLGYDLDKFNEIRDWLDNNDIPYKHKVHSRQGSIFLGGGTQRGHLGSLGTPTELMYEYEILVHEKDFDKVKL